MTDERKGAVATAEGSETLTRRSLTAWVQVLAGRYAIQLVLLLLLLFLVATTDTFQQDK